MKAAASSGVIVRMGREAWWRAGSGCLPADFAIGSAAGHFRDSVVTARYRSPNSVDLVIVGAGIAGLAAALEAHRLGQSVAGIDQRLALRVQHAIRPGRHGGGPWTARFSRTPLERHHLRRLRINDWQAAHLMTREASEAIARLGELEVCFDREGDHLDLGLEAAHSAPRIVHWGDATGVAIQRGLVSAVRRARIPVREQTGVTRLLAQDGRVTGVELTTGNHLDTLAADRVLLATGGAGRLYSRTTNPAAATGDGLALAYQSGRATDRLGILPVPPHCACHSGRSGRTDLRGGSRRGRIISATAAAIPSWPAITRPPISRPRDVVSRAIWREMSERAASNVFLDLTQLGDSKLRGRFSESVSGCAGSTALIRYKELIPVSPAAHYFMGGIRTGLDGRTSLAGLLAAGEVACTGFHGANRLASNSLLEGWVMGRRAAASAGTGEALGSVETPAREFEWPEPRECTVELPEMNWRNIGIVRSSEGLRQSLTTVTGPYGAGCRGSDRNLRIVSRLIALAALTRTESRGARYRADFPSADDAWLRHICPGTHRFANRERGQCPGHHDGVGGSDGMLTSPPWAGDEIRQARTRRAWTAISMDHCLRWSRPHWARTLATGT